MPKGLGALLAAILVLLVTVLIAFLITRSGAYALVAGGLFIIALYIILKKFNIM